MAILVMMQMHREGKATANSGPHHSFTRSVPAFGIFFIKLNINIHIHVNGSIIFLSVCTCGSTESDEID